MLLKYNFFRASFLHLTKDTDIILDHAAQIFLKWNIVKQCLLTMFPLLKFWAIWPYMLSGGSSYVMVILHGTKHFCQRTMLIYKTHLILKSLQKANISKCPQEVYQRFMYIAPSSDYSLLNHNVPFKVIPRRFEVVSWCLEWECCTFQKIDKNSFKSKYCNTMALNYLEPDISVQCKNVLHIIRPIVLLFY